MTTLALDTCLDVCSVALIDSERGGVLAAKHVPMSRGHAEALFPLIEGVFSEAGKASGDLTQIAVTVGPGTFTGIRIGLSAARGLAVKSDLPVIGITSLEAIRLCAISPALAVHPVAALIDARRGEVYGAIFGPSGEIQVQARIFPATYLSNHLPDETLIVAGSGAALAMAQSSRFMAAESDELPDASVWGQQVTNRTPLDAPVPTYLRAPDAKSPSEKSRVQRLSS